MNRDFSDKNEFVSQMYAFLEDERSWDDSSLHYLFQEANEWLNYRELDKLRNIVIVRLLSKTHPRLMAQYQMMFVDHSLDVRNEDVI